MQKTGAGGIVHALEKLPASDLGRWEGKKLEHTQATSP
jgi:hypothetical protein